MEDKKSQRQFDWGPPIQAGDSFKEWLVYLVIIAILGVGIWFLLDINDRKKIEKNIKLAKEIIANDQENSTIVSPQKRNKEEKQQSETPIVKQSNINKSEKTLKKQIPSVPKKEYFVQIGAFGDEASANEIYNLLKNESIESTLLKPNEQYEIYRLVVGPYSTEKEAENKVEQLNEIGFPSFVVEAQ